MKSWMGAAAVRASSLVFRAQQLKWALRFCRRKWNRFWLRSSKLLYWPREEKVSPLLLSPWALLAPANGGDTIIIIIFFLFLFIVFFLSFLVSLFPSPFSLSPISSSFFFFSWQLYSITYQRRKAAKGRPVSVLTRCCCCCCCCCVLILLLLSSGRWLNLLLARFHGG